MTDDVLYAPDTLDFIDRFLAEYRKAARPALVLEQYASRRPDLADELRLQAGFSFIDPADEPADLPDISLLREIGRGGMGVVYEGWQESLARPVAVKLLRMTDQVAERERFFHECRTLAGLHQTSIVPVHTAGRSGPWLYYVMPLIEGATLGELVRRAGTRAARGEPLPTLAGLVTEPPGGTAELPRNAVVHPGSAFVRSAVEVVVQVAEAIEYAHRQGVWHLDLKPANLMLDAGGHGWIIDFGIARQSGEPAPPAADGETTPTAVRAEPPGTTPYLTLAYAAPERWRGAADARSDVWGLGATLYELLTLRRPFPTNDSTTLAAAVAERDPPPAHLLATGVSPDLSAICQKALAKRADDRYPSAGALAADLRQWLGGHETSARAWSPVARLAARARRHKPWAVAAGTAVAGVVVALFLLWRQERLKADEAHAKGQAALAEEKLLHEADSHTKSRVWGLVELARQRLQVPAAGRRPDVRRLLLDAARERRAFAPDESTAILDQQFRSLFAQSLGVLDEAELKPTDYDDLPQFPFRDWPAAIHPDGKMIAIGTAHRPLIWKRGGTKPRPDPADWKLPRSEVAYGPAGGYLAEMESDETGGGLRVWDREATRMLGELIPPGKPGSVVRAVGFDEKESRLWAARDDGRVSGWALPGLTPLPDWPLAEKPGLPVTAAAFARGAGVVAMGDSAGRAIGFAADGRVVARRAAVPAQPVQALAWHPDGSRLAVGTEEGTVHLFDADGTLLFRFNVSPHGVSRIVFTPDGRWVSAHFRDGSARAWDSWTGRLALVGRSHPWGFSRDGRTFVAASPSGVQFGEFLYPEGLNRWEGHRSPVVHLRWSADSRRLASLASNFEARVWDVDRPGSAVAVFAGPSTKGFWATQGFVALSPDGRRLGYASGGRKASKAAIWDVETGKTLGTWDLPGGFEAMAAAGAAHPDRFVVVREQTRDDTSNVTTVAYDLEPGKALGEGRVLRRPEPGDSSRFIEHWLLPGGEYYMWAGPREPPAARRVEIFNVPTGKLVARLVPPPTYRGGEPYGLLAEDGKTAWITGYAATALRYDLSSREPPTPVDRMPMAISADGRWRAFLTFLDHGELIPQVSFHRAADNRPWIDVPVPDYERPLGGQYLFSPDGRYFAWAGVGGTIYRVDVPALAERVRKFEADMAAGK